MDEIYKKKKIIMKIGFKTIIALVKVWRMETLMPKPQRL